MPDRHPAIVVVNTGSTSTKCSIYRHDPSSPTPAPVADETIAHDDALLASFPGVSAQKDMREAAVREFLARALPAGERPVAVGAIGGMLPPVPSGVIRVDGKLATYCLETPVYHHASNLACPIALSIAADWGVQAYIVDPVGVDELAPVARLSGAPDFPRFSFVHALNIRATAGKLARRLGIPFEDLRVVVCHLGGGFSVAPLLRGRIVDSDNRMEGAPFTPERAGGVPPIPLLEACFSGKWTKDELLRRLYGEGGLYGYLGTRDIREVLTRIAAGDEFARLVMDAMIYQICKEIGAMASVLGFRLDGIVVTGGIAKDPGIVARIEEVCGRLAPVFRYPGENENEAIAQGVSDVLAGRTFAGEWPSCILDPATTDPLRGRRGRPWA